VRLVAAALTLALALGAAAAAPAQVPLSPLAPGERLVQTDGLGQVVTPADQATLPVFVVARAADLAAARRATAARLADTVAAARAVGIAAADIEAGPVTTDLLILPVASLFQVVQSGGAGEDGQVSAVAPLRITIRDLRRLDAVRAAVRAAGTRSIEAPVYALADGSVALRQARTRAMARARAAAETHAAGLNMRVARIARISERLGLEGLGIMVSESATFIRLFGGIWGAGPSGPEIETMAVVGVDFVLAPR